MKAKSCIKFFFLVTISGLLVGCALINPPENTPARESLSNLIITEINYNPYSDDPLLSDALEFIELYNRGQEEISLNKVAFSEGIDYQFSSNAVIKPGEFLVLASNKTEFKKRYNFEPFDKYTSNLKNSGERLALMDLSVEREFLAIEYSDKNPWPPAADGKGYSLVPISIDENANFSLPTQWRLSFKKNGSPGAMDPGPVFVNEVMTHTDPPYEDAIELYNPNSFPVDISGWFLTDSKDSPNKFRIPDGTVIQAGEYLVFYEKQFNNPALSSSFGLSENGEEAYLFANFSDPLTRGYYHGFSFEALERNKTIGRCINSAGEERFTTFITPTLGAANSQPAIGNVVITEIMYNAYNGRDEYVEIKNISDQPVPLFDPNYPVNTWKIKGFSFLFPQGITLQSGELMVISSDTISVEEFRTYYSVPAKVRIFNTAQGGLRNSGDTIMILQPLEPNTDNTEVMVPYKAIDVVAYEDGKLWPKEPDGLGMSLTRKKLDQFSDDPNNWIAAPPSPGRE